MRSHKQRGSSLMRTLVVAAATLGILFVLFSIYQYTQVDPETVAEIERRQQPTGPLPPPARIDVSGGPTLNVGSDGDVRVGEQRDVTLSIYPPEGSQAQIEVAVRTWRPMDGSPDEYQLQNPEFRIRTKSGNLIRTTAMEGRVEIKRRASGGMEMQRGHLTGNVVIEIDRRTEEERAALPEDQQNEIDPDELIRATLDDLTFDMEYAELEVRGPFVVSARDVELVATDLQVRFDELQNRVEYLRIREGERLVLSQHLDQFGGGFPGAGGSEVKTMSLVDALRATIQKRLNLPEQPAPPPAEETKPSEPIYVTADGTPIDFRPGKAAEEPRTVKYIARFEDNVDAAHETNGEVNSRMLADWLEVIRDFTNEDRARARDEPAAAPAGAPVDDVPTERVVLRWTGRLVVEALSPNDERAEGVERARIRARGEPARLLHAQGSAKSQTITFEPDSGKVWFDAAPGEMASLDSPEQGSLRGPRIELQRDEDETTTLVRGPGEFVRLPRPADVGTADSPEGTVRVAFTDDLVATGRYKTIKRRRLSLSQTFSQTEILTLERAEFTGTVKMEQQDSALAADEITLLFSRDVTRKEHANRIERLLASGNVDLTMAGSRLQSESVEGVFTTDPDGNPTPLTVTAVNNVRASQPDRNIEADKTLVFEFESVVGAPPPFDLSAEIARAAQSGEDVSRIDWEARRRAHEVKQIREIKVKRLRAEGNVHVADSAQDLDIQSESIDCALTPQQDIERAEITGTAQHPAVVRLHTETVTGELIRINAVDDWAEVPGPGRMTMMSHRDLDGQKLDDPIPIAIDWSESMYFRGRENKAVFLGRVHLASRGNTTFDCTQRVEVEFVPNVTDPAKPGAGDEWWILSDVIGRPSRRQSGSDPARSMSREIAFVRAIGAPVAKTVEVNDAGTIERLAEVVARDELEADLRKRHSRIYIEGPGHLTMLDMKSAATGAQNNAQPSGLFDARQSSGPYGTMIEWQRSMLYSFANEQTHFEGKVHLAHFTGNALFTFLEAEPSPGRSLPDGGVTWLDCEKLSVYFVEESGRSARDDGRFGGINAARLDQLEARGDAVLLDDAHGLTVSADVLTYEHSRTLISAKGTKARPAVIQRELAGALQDLQGTQLFYNTRTGEAEGTATSFRGTAP